MEKNGSKMKIPSYLTDPLPHLSPPHLPQTMAVMYSLRRKYTKALVVRMAVTIRRRSALRNASTASSHTF